MKVKLSNGVVTCVYNDRLRPLMEALGQPQIVRASTVEFNPFLRIWEAVLVTTGEVIASGPNRNEVIQQEIKWLEDKL